MRLLVQRVKNASVSIDGQVVAQIQKGLLVLVGVGKQDAVEDIKKLSVKLVNLRIFEDEKKKMNLNIKQVNGQVLSVPQFTLYADMSKGNRPGFDMSASPDMAREYWQVFNNLLTKEKVPVEKGVFGAHMDVGLVNDGPVTILLESR